MPTSVTSLETPEELVIRRRFGFSIRFAHADRENNVFTWAVSHPGDIDEVHARYYADPQGVALQGIADHLDSWHITRVEPVQIP